MINKLWKKIIDHPYMADQESFSIKSAVIILTGTLLICIYLYSGLASYFHRFFPYLTDNGRFASIYPSLYNYVFGLTALGLIPALIIKFGFRERLGDYGVQLGDWRFGLLILSSAAPLFILLSYLSARDPLFQAAYPLSAGSGDSWMHILIHEGGYIFYYIGFEFLFRGFMLFGLRRELGDWNAVLIQTMASTLIHIGKPVGETFSAIIGGILFGIFVLRCRSILYQLILHWILGVGLNLALLFH
ncbi:MAG: hypothetical protein B6244_00720 [Candidatus Cloacimonetes bacterium 4572_55]|nr:MAG: hypothetical protein B6244_00720 [Candidatus Cloacimonetes bacterium 4572_55]